MGAKKVLWKRKIRLIVFCTRRPFSTNDRAISQSNPESCYLTSRSTICPQWWPATDLEHHVGKVYQRNRRKSDNTKIKVIKPPHYPPPFELYAYYTRSGIKSQVNSPLQDYEEIRILSNYFFSFSGLNWFRIENRPIAMMNPAPPSFSPITEAKMMVNPIPSRIQPPKSELKRNMKKLFIFFLLKNNRVCPIYPIYTNLQPGEKLNIISS